MPARHRAHPLAPIVALVAAGTALVPGTALAHSGVTGTTPAEGATLTTAPADATVTFAENIRREFAYTRLTSDAGQEVATTPIVDGPRLVARFTTPLPDGRYTLAYRIASADTHPVSGVVHFTVKTGASTSPTTAPSSAPTSPSVSTSPSPAATPADGGGSSFWYGLAAAGVVAAVAGWLAGRAVRSRRR